MRKAYKAIISAIFAVLLLLSGTLPLYALTPTVYVSNTYKSGVYYKNLTGVKLTGDMRKDIVAVAQSQIGYHEANSSSGLAGTTSGSKNYTEYGYFMADRWNNTYYRNAAWCGMFVSWCAAMANVPESIVYPSATAKPYGSYSFRFFGDSALSGASYKTLYDLKVRGGSYTPRPGDFMFYSPSSYKGNKTSISYTHVGIVETCTYVYDSNGNLSSMKLTTIEGNSSNGVNRKNRSIAVGGNGKAYSGAYIVGFGVPAYKTQIVDEPDPPAPEPSFDAYDLGEYPGDALKTGASGQTVAKVQMAVSLLSLKYSSVPAQEVTGTFDANTDAAVRKLQSALGLDSDGSVGPATWKSLRSAVNDFVKAQSKDVILSGNKLVLYTGNASALTLPETVATIGGYAFGNDKTLTSVTFGSNLVKVEAYAFSGCSALTKASYGIPQEKAQSAVVSLGNEKLLAAASTYVQPVVVPDPVDEPESDVFDFGEYPGVSQKSGSQGVNTAKVQMALAVLALKYPTVQAPEVTGVFDEATDTAVRQYQKALGLSVDGSAGRATWTSLRSELAAYIATVKEDYVLSGSTLLLWTRRTMSAVLPASVRKIGGCAFIDNDHLVGVHLGSLTGIGPYAFSGAENVSRVEYTAEFGTLAEVTAPTGNESLLTAPVSVSYVIVFNDPFGEETRQITLAGSLPQAPEKEAVVEGQRTVRYFAGWSQEIVSASANATYTALWAVLPAEDLSFYSEEKLAYRGDRIAMDLMLNVPEGLTGLSHLAVSLDVSDRADDLRFDGFDSNFAGMQVKQASDGVFRISCPGVEFDKAGSVSLLTLHFSLDEEAPDGEIRFEFLQDDASDRVVLTAYGKEYDLPCSFEGGTVMISDAAIYDLDHNGRLDINDTTVMLNLLAASGQPSVPRAGFDPFTISDVSLLLNYISLPSDRWESGGDELVD